MIDKRMLVDSVEVTLVGPPDKWGKQKELSTLTLGNVRFDVATNLNSANRNSNINRTSTLFVYPKYCNVTVDDSWLDAKVIYAGHEYTIQSYETLLHPFSQRVFCYEIGVI
ncbi:minor capsid protein [Enterococcus cecorum]|uniref:putative minor capsid protein n=1 Tax=Enterococcus cecorum TaxID=44008 RepID=UPI001FAB59E0|nr:putative minor capsid protein [Enterococcus cecorum]MCJ0552249.1 minor capsid protein [Enterococcus cecorum]MCJ0557795.1 minor capsid protein [Enterococcus cecorum]MCJ0562596.1 minor capsid protein [Enterococcus cecorum]